MTKHRRFIESIQKMCGLTFAKVGMMMEVGQFNIESSNERR
jgi:hypothetical protein